MTANRAASIRAAQAAPGKLEAGLQLDPGPVRPGAPAVPALDLRTHTEFPNFPQGSAVVSALVRPAAPPHAPRRPAGDVPTLGGILRSTCDTAVDDGIKFDPRRLTACLIARTPATVACASTCAPPSTVRARRCRLISASGMRSRPKHSTSLTQPCRPMARTDPAGLPEGHGPRREAARRDRARHDQHPHEGLLRPLGAAARHHPGRCRAAAGHRVDLHAQANRGDEHPADRP